MKLKIKEIKGISVVELKGNVMGGPDATLLNEELHKLVDAGKKNVVVDLGEVKFMNSSGLGMLIGALATIRNAGGKMKLARASEKIESLLVVTKLVTVFEHHDTVSQAVASFS
ncbi:MAG: STAS domain-containing protein [bacterium]